MSNEPRVWLGCLACYNAGRLVGEWLDPSRAAEITPDELHAETGHTNPETHEELWVMDHEYVPLSGEFGQAACQSIADAWEAVGETQWGAYLAYSRTGMGGMGGMDGSGVSDPSDFEEAYAGEWDSWRDYADEFADEMIACRTADRRPYGHQGSGDDDDLLSRYFDYAAFARDLAMDYATEPTPDGGVYVFRSY